MKVTIQDSKTSVTVRPRDFKVTVSGARGPQGPQGDPGQGGEWGTIVGDITEQTDLYTALEDKVPYTGATGDLNLGEQKLLFANASELREGTYDFGGQGGISQICSVGFENNWQSGFNHIFDNNGLIRESLHCFDIVPDSSFDSSLRFKVGSLWKLDDGTIYECVDATIGAAVWQLYNPYATDISGLVPYTGATQDVNLGEYGAQLGNLEFDNTPTNVPTTAGSVYWNDTDGTLNIVLKGGQTISRVGETQHIRALNNTGAQIARGKVVYVLGAQGQRLTIALADADTEILSKDTIGFTAEAIADGAEGFVIVQGVINNVSTTGMADGATVFLSQTAGSYTTTPPADPAHLVVLGFIVNGGSGGAGSIYVKVDNGYELEELHNVSNSAKTTPVGDDALLLRDSADNNLWKRLTWTNALAGVKSHMDTFKSVANGYASLDGSGKVPASELPSYVDDVLEVASFASLPVTGETGKIYVTLDTNKCYRWSGSVYVEVSAGGASAWGAITGTLSSQTDLQTALDGKQASLSITTTGTSGAATLVGSTLNIPQYQGVLTNPVTGTGTAGQVAYFSGTSAVTGSSSLVWDAANGRLGIGTASPSQRLDVNGAAIFSTGTSSQGTFISGASSTRYTSNTGINTNAIYLSASAAGNDTFVSYIGGSATSNIYMYWNSQGNINTRGSLLLGAADGTGVLSGPSARLHVRGSGTTSATTALLVQNSTPSELFKVLDNGLTTVSNTTNTNTHIQLFSGITGFVGSFSTPAIKFGNTNTGIYTDTNRISFVSNGTYAGAFSSDGFIGNHVWVSAAANTNDVNTPKMGPYRLNAQGLSSGLAGNSFGDISLSTNNTARLIATYTGDIIIGTTTSSGRLTVRGSGTTSATNGLLVEDSAGTDTFTIRDDGGYAFRNGTVGLAQTGYTTFTNLTTDRTCDANATTVEELADILGTLIEDLKTKGIIAA